MTTRDDSALADALRALALALEPRKQGECWPDPVAWDGRPLAEQARDLLALADCDGCDRYPVESRAVFYALRGEPVPSLAEIARRAEAVIGGAR